MKTQLRFLTIGAVALLAAPVQAGPPTFAAATTTSAHCGFHSGCYGLHGIYGGYYGIGFLDPGYFGYYQAQPTTVINNYYLQSPGQPAVAVQPPVPHYGRPPAGADPSQMPAPTPVEAPPVNVVRVDISLPSDADLSIQGVKMPQTGSSRRFVSPPLERGQNYTYEVRATWMENGREVKEVRQLRVRAGDHQSITFIASPTEMAKAGR